MDVIVGGGAVLDEVIAPQDQGGGKEELCVGVLGWGKGGGSGNDSPLWTGHTHGCVYTYLEEEEEGGKGTCGPVCTAIGAGVSLDVVKAGAAPGELAPKDGRHEREEGDHHRHAQHKADGHGHLGALEHVIGSGHVGDVEQRGQHGVEAHVCRIGQGKFAVGYVYVCVYVKDGSIEVMAGSHFYVLAVLATTKEQIV